MHANLSEFTVINDNLYVTFQTLHTEFKIERPLENHEIVRETHRKRESCYFLVQSALYEFEKYFGDLNTLLILCDCHPGSHLHNILFIQSQLHASLPVGRSLQTPLSRVSFIKPQSLPRRNTVLRG
jgi:hypothetical protein